MLFFTLGTFIPPSLDLVCNKTFKPTFLKIPNLGLELCASQVLLDYFASKYNIFKEPQLELISLTIPNTVHFELDLMNPAPLKLLDFVLKSEPVEKFWFRGDSFGFSLSLPFKSNFSVLKLSMFLHFVFWVDPQLFRLLVYGEFLYIIQ